MDQLIMKVSKDILMGRKGGSHKEKAHRIFIAYRMNNKVSINFRKDFEEALQRHGKVEVLDGQVGLNKQWPAEIRKRIKQSNLLVADITGPSKEVLFEIGVAGGKPRFLVVESEAERAKLPSWLTNYQMLSFEEEGTAKIALTTWEKISMKNQDNTRRPPPIPGQIIWLQSERSSWCDTSYNQLSYKCAERSLTLTKMHPEDLNSAEDIRDAQKGWLYIGCLDGLSQDYAIHFLAGDVTSRQFCGSGRGPGQKIKRSMVLLGEKESNYELLVADSVKKVSKQSIQFATVDKFLEVVTPFLDKHRRWLSMELDK